MDGKNIRIPEMAGTSDALVRNSTERFNQHHFKNALERLGSEVANLKQTMLAVTACVARYAEDPVRNGATAKANLGKLLDELAHHGNPRVTAKAS